MWQATLPANIQIDSQDQLYYTLPNAAHAGRASGADGGARPLIRARIPNGKPWNPLDGFNLTAAPNNGTGPSTVPMPGIPRTFSACGEVTPQPPRPAPNPFTPAPAAPAVGGCSQLVDGASLLYQYPSSDYLLASSAMDTAGDCEALCKATNCCSGFTWHDNSTGSYFKKCYFVTNPLKVWTRAFKQLGHVSGLCNHSNNSKRSVLCPGAGSTSFPCGGDAQVVCKATNTTQVDGPLGVNTGSAASLTSNVVVEDCMQHLPDMGNNWPVPLHGEGLALHAGRPTGFAPRGSLHERVADICLY